MFLITSCKSYNFQISDAYGISIDRIDSISVRYYPWSNHPRITITPDVFYNYVKIEATIKNQDSIKNIINELNNLSYYGDVCYCNSYIKVSCKLYCVDVFNEEINKEDPYTFEFSFSMSTDGYPIDGQNWRKFKRSDKLIELLQLPPYPD